MKLKNLSLILILGLIIVLSAQAGFCTEEIAQHIPAAADIPSKQPSGISITAAKFIVTMMGVVISSIVIWAGLSIYNKIISGHGFSKVKDGDDVLNTPKTIEDAVTFFIKRNKLK